MYLLYFVLWVIFNGAVTVEICAFGVVIAAVIFAFTCRFMDYSVKKEKMLYRRIFKMVRYLFVLLCEIIRANFTVIHMILSEKEEIEPVLVSFRTDMKTQTGKAFLANAITLTPGTITVTLEGQEYLVHCLDESLAVGVDSSVFVDLLKDMEASKAGEA